MDYNGTLLAVDNSCLTSLSQSVMCVPLRIRGLVCPCVCVLRVRRLRRTNSWLAGWLDNLARTSAPTQRSYNQQSWHVIHRTSFRENRGNETFMRHKPTLVAICFKLLKESFTEWICSNESGTLKTGSVKMQKLIWAYADNLRIC